MTTGERIKKRRKELGVSAETLADRCGLSPATIYRYENGDIGNMGADKIAAIAKALETTSGTLLGEADFSEQFAVVTGNKKLMALYETMRANADLISPSSEAPETTAFRTKAALEAMRKKGAYVSDMLELTLNAPDSINISVSTGEFRLLDLYRALNEEGQEKLLDYAEDLSASGRYIKSNPAGMVHEK